MNTSPKRPLLISLAVTALVTAFAWLLPNGYASTAVALSFYAATYWLVLRQDGDTIRQHGVSLGGLMEPEKLDWQRLARRTGQALAWCLLLMLLTFPAYWFAWLWWWQPNAEFRLNFGDSPLDELSGQLLAIALPEEMFYRGYLQSALDGAWKPKRKILGAPVGWGLLVSSAIFALGHLATEPNLGRLSVFFPALLFGWLRARTGGIGTAVFYHAACNLFAALLARSYGLI